MHSDYQIGSAGFAIGQHRIAVAAVLAPLTGVTDLAFRRIACRFGAGYVVSEMVASRDLLAATEEARLRAEGRGIDLHVVQLAGCAPHPMAEAAALAEASGAAVIDINMGCPAKRVTGSLAGAALMRDLDAAESIIASVAGAVSVPVTVKMRLGWEHEARDAPELARRAEAHGVAAVTVHGRTRAQFYNGAANWDAVGEVVDAVRIPVIVNGDIQDGSSARAALAKSGARAVMIGRAALGRPWLVGQVGAELAGRRPAQPTDTERREAAIEHYEGLLSLYGRRIGARHARKHLAAYAERAAEDGGGLAPDDRTRLVTTDDPAEAIALLARAFEPALRSAA